MTTPTKPPAPPEGYTLFTPKAKEEVPPGTIWMLTKLQGDDWCPYVEVPDSPRFDRRDIECGDGPIFARPAPPVREALTDDIVDQIVQAAALATNDPGAFTMRADDYGEALGSWQDRAMAIALAPFRRAPEPAGVTISTEGGERPCALQTSAPVQSVQGIQTEIPNALSTAGHLSASNPADEGPSPSSSGQPWTCDKCGGGCSAETAKHYGIGVICNQCQPTAPASQTPRCDAQEGICSQGCWLLPNAVSRSFAECLEIELNGTIERSLLVLNALHEATQKARTLETENATLRAALGDKMHAPKTWNQMIDEIANLRWKLSLATDAANKGDAARRNAGPMEAEIERLRKELAEVRHRLTVEEGDSAALDAERDALRSEVSGLRERVALYESDFIKVSEQRDRAQNELAAAEETVRLQHDLMRNAEDRGASKAQEELTDLRVQLATAQQACREAVAQAENVATRFSSSFCNINDTCRVRGFETGPSGRTTEDRVIAMAQAYDKAKQALAAESAKLAEAVRALEESRETNRRFHRRVQAVESGEFAKPAFQEHFRLKNEVTMLRHSWRHEFDRLGRAFSQTKDYFEVIAKALGLPFGKYHSVNDCQLESGKDGVIRAHVIADNKVISFSVLEVLTQLAEKYEQAIAAAKGGQG